MERETTGIVISVSKQWWLKVNTKAIRKGPMDGTVFPYIIKVSYNINGTEYIKRKWIGAGVTVPAKSSTVKIIYEEDSPKRAKIIF